MPFCNTTLEEAHIHEDPLWKGFTFHHFGLFLAAVFGLISVVITFTLVFLHATHYSRPWEQRHIIRILLMIPIYSTVSFLSYLYYRHAVYFEVLRDCYEAFAIASFFTLLCHYVAPTLHEQKIYFRSMIPVNWFWGVFFLQKCTGGENRGPFRKPRSGLTWFNVVYIGVYQYCLIRVLFTIVSVVTEPLGLYCEASLSPAFAHIWTLGFEAASVTIAMFCLVQFYIQMKTDLAEHRPFLKVLAIKLVIFFSFWQTIVISLLSSSRGPLQPTNKLSYQDIKVGIPSVMLCIEMAIFSVMHIFAFPWKPYTITRDPLAASGSGYSGEVPKYRGGPFGVRALLDAFNIWDVVKASARGFRWLFVGARKRHEDISYVNPSKMDNSYQGPSLNPRDNFGTELRPSVDRHGRSQAEDDRVGLLGYSAPVGGRGPSPSPQRPSYATDEYGRGDDSHIDLGSINQHRRQFSAEDAGLKPSEFADDSEEPATYHPGFGPSAVHPALREGEAAPPGGQWNHWGGVGEGSGDAQNLGRPPTYRTHDQGSRF